MEETRNLRLGASQTGSDVTIQYSDQISSLPQSVENFLRVFNLYALAKMRNRPQGGGRRKTGIKSRADDILILVFRHCPLLGYHSGSTALSL
jgi:hypothetical protein